MRRQPVVTGLQRVNDGTIDRLAVAQGSPLEGALSRTLKQAELVRIPGGIVEEREALAYRRADVLASTIPVAHRIVAELPDATVMVGRVSALRVVIAVPKKDAAELASLNEFLRDAKRDRVLAEAIKKANLRGVRRAFGQANGLRSRYRTHY